jgi:hypothetical protein
MRPSALNSQLRATLCFLPRSTSCSEVCSGVSTVRATIVFRGPTSPSRPGLDFGGLVRPGQVSVALGLHTGTYRGLAATGSRHSVVVQVFMPNMALKLAAGVLKCHETSGSVP